MSTAEPRNAALAICQVFNRVFARTDRTVMLGGGSEPLFLPETSMQPARIVHTRDYAASALHEAAHWCIAGPNRRQHIDYGYPYLPPPRSQSARDQFFALELKCQALELVLSQAAGLEFRISLDDVDAPLNVAQEFEQAVHRRARRLLDGRLTDRAARLRNSLSEAFASSSGPAHG